MNLTQKALYANLTFRFSIGKRAVCQLASLNWKLLFYFSFEKFLITLRFVRPVRLVVRTLPFHGGNTGSNPVRVAIFFSVNKPFFLKSASYPLNYSLAV